MKEQTFINKLNNLFDIALKSEFEKLTTTQQNFLKDQWKINRHSCVSSIQAQPIKTPDNLVEEDQLEIVEEHGKTKFLNINNYCWERVAWKKHLI